jgi:hypothetical protein
MASLVQSPTPCDSPDWLGVRVPGSAVLGSNPGWRTEAACWRMSCKRGRDPWRTRHFSAKAPACQWGSCSPPSTAAAAHRPRRGPYARPISAHIDAPRGRGPLGPGESGGSGQQGGQGWPCVCIPAGSPDSVAAPVEPVQVLAVSGDCPSSESQLVGDRLGGHGGLERSRGAAQVRDCLQLRERRPRW